MKDAKASIEEAIQVLEDACNDEALLRASGRAMGLLGNALVALESEEVVAEGWADPVRGLQVGDRLFDRLICVYLDRISVGNERRHVRIVAVKEVLCAEST